MARKPKTLKTVATLKYKAAKRRSIPTAEYQSAMQKEETASIAAVYAPGIRTGLAMCKALTTISRLS